MVTVRALSDIKRRLSLSLLLLETLTDAERVLMVISAWFLLAQLTAPLRSSTPLFTRRRPRRALRLPPVTLPHGTGGGHDSAPGSACSRGRAVPVRRSPHGERRDMAPAGRYSMKAVC